LSNLVGTTLADFRIVRRLGQGGMGQVYLAEQLSLRRQVALKVLRPDLACREEALPRFRAEAEAVARLTHANVVQVYAVGESDGVHYMALEYVEGCSLREYLTRKGAVPVPLALSIMRQVTSALERAAEMGIIHRDIKPENILLNDKGEAKVADFGLSRCFAVQGPALALTQAGMTVGTPLYMSPEQVEGKPLDPRTDLYSFGVTCYHMLAGEPPFRGETAFDLALKHVQAEALPLQKLRGDLPPDLCAIVHRMMAKKPEHRFQSAREILEELDRASERIGPVADSGKRRRAPIGLPTRVGRQLVRKPLWLVLTTLVLGCLAGAFLGWDAGRPLRRPAPPVSPAAEGLTGEAGPNEKKREQFLLAAVEEYARPQDDTQLALGLGHCYELAMFYLDRWRLADADRFFQGLIDNPDKVKPYMVLGRLGHAIVLAFEDRALDSDQAFIEVLRDRDQALARSRALVNRNPRFLEVVQNALCHNAANLAASGQILPPELEPLRRARPLVAPWPTTGRTAGKSSS
jgi:serine/threonine-protein kinase